MRNPLFNVPLRYLIPILLGVFVLGVQGFLYNANHARGFAHTRDDAVEGVRNQLNRAQNIIELLHKDATLLLIRTLVSSFGAEPGHEVMILTDEKRIVLASTSMKLLGKPATLPSTPHDLAAIATVMASGGVETFLSNQGRTINGYASVCALSAAGQLRMNNCGLLYLRNDITPALAAVSDALAVDASQDGIVVLALALILWVVIHFSLTRRTQMLIDTTRQFSSGDPRARSHLIGHDELAVVGKAVDSMLDQIVDDRVALEHSEDRLRTVFESIADGIIAFDNHGVVHAFNSSCEDMYIIDRNHIIGSSIATLVAPSHRKTFALDTPKDGILETVGIRPDGTEFDVEMTMSQMTFKGEDQTIAIVRDVTERKRLENLQSEFISVVSHELRTPLTSIQGALGLMIGGVAGQIPRDLRQMLEMCKRNSDRLLNLINDILDMDKISSGNLEFHFTANSSGKILREAVTVNQPYALAHDVNFVTKNNTSSIVMVDTGRIQQVLTNLLSNAVKFSKPSDIITVSAIERDGVIRFAVTDSGPGIPEHYHSKIFDRFIQVENANTRSSDGTGLGLSISKSIVEHHHGTIGLDSELGKGSTFWFDLPVSEEARNVPSGKLAAN